MIDSPFLKSRKRLLENSVGFVIYDGFPVSKGHCLIVPHRVYSDYFDSTVKEIEGRKTQQKSTHSQRGKKDTTVDGQ